MAEKSNPPFLCFGDGEKKKLGGSRTSVLGVIAFPGVRRSAEDGFASMRTFFSRNLQYKYLNFLSAEFFPKKC